MHKPSFMRQLDKGFTSDDESALLHIICAHGAKYVAHLTDPLPIRLNGHTDLTIYRFYVLNQHDHPPASNFIRLAGNQWAKRAEFLVLANFGKISVQRLMVCQSSTTHLIMTAPAHSSQGRHIAS